MSIATTLDRALRRGDDTRPVRRALAEQARQQAETVPVVDQQTALQVEADAVLAELRAEIAAEMDGILPGFTPDIPVNTAPLFVWLQAGAEREQAEQTLAAQQGELDALQARLAAVDAELAGLRGATDEVGLGRVHNLTLDRADLSALIEGLQAVMEPPPDTSAAERAWRRAARDARFAVRYQVMQELESRLLRAAIEARQVYGNTDVRYRYKPALAMRQACQTGGII